VTVRLRLALTVFLAGLATALGVIAAVAIAFQRFEHESTWQRGDAFLGRVVAQHDDLLEQHRRDADAFAGFLRSLVLYEPDSQLYLLDAAGAVLASTGRMQLPAGFRVALQPVQQAASAAGSSDHRSAAYVMGDDPEYMEADAVVAARALRRTRIGPAAADDGYLYLVCRKPGLPAGKRELLGSSLASPALVSVLLVCAFTTALAAWAIVTVTRPLRVLSEEVAMAAREGFSMTAGVARPRPGPQGDDEFGRLRGGFLALLATLRMQWDELSRLDRFRRESVSNLSHDLRSPLTATVACLETLDQRWATDAARADDRRLLEVALRNTRNAAGMVHALGDLALLDEPAFQLHPMRVDLGELLDDIALRFAERAARLDVVLHCVVPQGDGPEGGAPVVASVDIELFERAVANVVDNALKHTPAGGRVTVAAVAQAGGVCVTVADTGAGIAPDDLPHLFDRLYQARASTAPATAPEGKGLGLAIVRRIVELHRGTVAVRSTQGQGTVVTIGLPAG